MESRVYTPLNLPLAVEKSGLEVPKMFWGSYRPGVYFGLKTRSPADLLFGMMWMIPELVHQNDIGFRHWSEQGDNLDRFGWIQHDGENFGVQEIVDRGLKITTSFVKSFDGRSIKKGGAWTARIKVEPKNKKVKVKEIILFLYAAMDENSSGYKLRPVFGGPDAQQMTGIVGKTNALGDFKMDFVTNSGSNIRHSFHSSIESAGPHRFSDDVKARLRMINIGSENVIGLNPETTKAADPNMILYQINAQLPFEIDVVFNPSQTGDMPLTGEDYTTILQEKLKDFDEKFEATFALQKLGFNQSQIRFAQAAMSNMIGGIGYFFGHSLVQ